MDIWPWICKIPYSEETSSPLVYELATSKPSVHNSATHSHSLRLLAKPNQDPTCVSVTFFVCFHKSLESESKEDKNILWESDAYHHSEDTPFTFPFITDLLVETISRAPTQTDRTPTVIPRSRLHQILTSTISQILSSQSSDSFSSFFNLVLLARLFWMCACDAPTEVGLLYFNELLTPNLADYKYPPVLRSFLMLAGVDVEQRFMRALGYMFSKWMILKDMELTSKKIQRLGFSYARETHGLWVLKGYTPVLSMEATIVVDGGGNDVGPKQSLLKYALAHQQLEAVIQIEYSVIFLENYIQVKARIDNLRLHAAKLVFRKSNNHVGSGDQEEGETYINEKHSPSRIRIWVGPELGATYVSCLSLTRSKETVDMNKLKDKSDGDDIGREQTERRKWMWNQDAEGNTAVFEGAMCDEMNGFNGGSWKALSGEDKSIEKARNGSRRRGVGENRWCLETGSVVLAMDEFGDEVTWRLDKELRGNVLKWRLGAQVWMTYSPTNVKSLYRETKRVEWCDELDLSL